MSRSERLLKLPEVLRRHRRPVRAQTLADETAVSVRTLYRAIASPRAQGAEIEGEPGLGYVLRPGFVLPPLIQRFNAGAASAAANWSAILEFEVDDVDHVLSSLGGAAIVVPGPTVMPWGNRSLLLRDPDGSLVNVFSRPQAAGGASR